jgi:hypothetical protein
MSLSGPQSVIFHHVNSPLHHFAQTVEAYGNKAIVFELFGILFGYIVPLFVVIPWSIAGIIRSNTLIRENTPAPNASGVIPPATADSKRALAEEARRLFVAGLVVAIIAMVIGVGIGIAANFVGKNYSRNYSQSLSASSPTMEGASGIITMAYLVPAMLVGVASFIITAVAETRLRRAKKAVKST